MVGEREIAGAPEPVLFTATAMIGMIALAGIVVRNSLILVEFIDQSRARGLALKEALLQAGSVRMRPVLLTAGTTLAGQPDYYTGPGFQWPGTGHHVWYCCLHIVYVSGRSGGLPARF